VDFRLVLNYGKPDFESLLIVMLLYIPISVGKNQARDNYTAYHIILVGFILKSTSEKKIETADLPEPKGANL
jgi:hypothetical protein